MTSDLRDRIASLSPEKRALLESKLMKQAGPGDHGQVIARRDPSLPCRLSFAQERLWFLDQLEPGTPLYHIASVVRLTGDLNVDALREALGAMVGRHQVLRTTIASAD